MLQEVGLHIIRAIILAGVFYLVWHEYERIDRFIEKVWKDLREGSPH